MRTRGNVKLMTLLAAMVALALLLVVPAGLSDTALADVPPSCRFWGEVTLCCQVVPPGTVVTVRVQDPVTGPSWTTSTYMRSGRSVYVIDIPPYDPAVPQEGGVQGEAVYFSITYQDTVFTQVIPGPSSIWQRVGFVHHPLRLGTLGDANLDGVIDYGDIDKVDRIRRGLDPRTPCADVNRDGRITIADIVMIRLIIEGWIEPPDC